MFKEPEKYLKPLAKKVSRKNHAVFDIESNQWTEFEMGGFYDGKKYIQCDSLEDLFDAIITEKNRSRIIFAHNGGRFDFLFLMEYLRRVRNIEARIVPQGPRITALKIRHGKEWITLQDSYTLLAYSLDVLCETFNPSVRKLRGAINFETERVDKNNPTHREYLKADCLSLYEIIHTYKQLPFIKDVGIKLTRSSVGLAAWRTTLKNPIRTTSNNIQQFCRSAYAGGRCEIFRQLFVSGRRVDVNSLYPSMLLKPLPTEHIGPSSTVDDFGFHDVTVEVPDCYLPVLWTKTPKLIFPTGIFRGTFFSEELKLAIANGARVITHHRGEAFTSSNDLFSEFISTAYQMRLDNPGANPLNILAKDLMNHTYGKFAEREEKKSMIKVDQLNPDSWPKEFEMFHSEKMFRSTGLIEIEKWKRSAHMLVHLSAAVTAYGRIHMAENIYLPNQDNIAYTDTDSGDISGKIATGAGLGQLKDEFNIKNAFYLLPKGYWIETEEGKIIKKLKGFSKKSLESITYELFSGGNIKSVERKLATFRSALIRENTYLTMLDIKKSVVSEYSKRKLLPGGNTRPWNIKEGMLR